MSWPRRMAGRSRLCGSSCQSRLTLFIKRMCDEVIKSRNRVIVILAPYQVRGKLQPESSISKGLEILWTPVPALSCEPFHPSTSSGRTVEGFTGETTFCETHHKWRKD